MMYLIWLANDCSSVKEIVSGLKGQGIETEIILVQDGVFFADKGNPYSALLKGTGSKIHAIKHHVEERGLLNRLALDVNLVDYSDAVDIMMEQSDKIISL
ncbi:MAG: sulfurtransferase complex subunit TusB [Candidatus Thorarchaeota archaeon]|nr:MAG: sulfurtransferase complex subunit TusB [Candidatus Thorarchaeota archaeon]